MKSEQKALLNAQILTLLNRYLKHGMIVKATDAFYFRGEIEGIIKVVYEQGKLDGAAEALLDKVIDKIGL